MNIIDRFRSRVANIISPTKNSVGQDLARSFLRNGNRSMQPDWTQVVMSDQDLYTGYPYAAIRQRANAVAATAIDNVRTDAEKSVMEAASKNDKPVVHPYLDILDRSRTFSNRQFWYEISSYLDLEGIYYLMAIRNFSDGRTGAIQEFKLLNPYNIQRILSKDNLEVAGYTETRSGMFREIPKEMIIEIRDFNPFDSNIPFAMTDAAKEAQFTLKTASDYTRHALKNNINAPGILSTDVILPTADFENFKARVVNHTKGEPLFANGTGAVKWDSMNVELSKASIDRVNEINRDALLAVAGVSKTILGIEQSGTTRETARVQRDLNMEGQILPRIDLILDALNQDYKNNYSVDYEKTKFVIVVDNPMATDYDAEIKDADARSKRLDIFNQLVNKGYDTSIAAKYSCGEIDLEDLGEPTNEPVQVDVPQPATPPPANDQQTTNAHEGHGHDVPDVIQNGLSERDQGLIQQQQGALKNAIINIESSLVASVIAKVAKRKNDAYEDESEVITKRDKNTFEQDLLAVLSMFYGIVFPLYGNQVMKRRGHETGKLGFFKLDRQSKNYIEALAKKVSGSHIDTIVNDMLKTAREAALQGKSIDEITRALRQEFSDTITTTRAQAIARTETNRAFTRAQFEADRQFIAQNKLEGRVYKKWITRSDNPCVFCRALANEPAIPFDNAFRDLGEAVNVVTDENGKTKVNQLNISFEPLEAGNAHVNCSCAYQLIIE